MNLLHVIPERLISDKVFIAQLASERMAEKSFFLLDVEIYRMIFSGVAAESLEGDGSCPGLVDSGVGNLAVTMEADILPRYLQGEGVLSTGDGGVSVQIDVVREVLSNTVLSQSHSRAWRPHPVHIRETTQTAPG